MVRRVTDLSSLAWQLGQAARQPFGPQPADDRGQVSTWLPARVPGDVRADLAAAGVLAGIETPEEMAASRWVDEHDWWYRVELPGDRPPAQVAVLEADGIDYYSAIWLDGDLLATHAGMAGRQSVNLSPWLNRPGNHELAIRVWGGGVFERRQTAVRQATQWMLDRFQPGIDLRSDRMATPKAQFSFGWDFAPRLLSAGIWDDIRLVGVRKAYIMDLWVQGEALDDADDPTPACWQVGVQISRWHPLSARVQITIQPENFAGSGYQSLTRTVELCAEEPTPCTDEYRFELDMARARRWWPWDQGEPCLYRVTVRLWDEDGVLDETSRVTGVRSVRRESLPGRAAQEGGRALAPGPPWRFVVNGRPVFLRGANWAPVDVLPGRADEADYQRLLDQARAAGINFLRVWGGGVREKRAFWEGCDRRGIMAWQEFPLACDFLHRYGQSQRYLDELATEAMGTVRALRSHPSLVAWCGGNEINPEREAAQLGRLKRVVDEQDGSRPWIAALPADGDVHQWDVWHGRAPWTDLADGQAPFMSEYGLQALPDAATVREMFPRGVPDSLRDPGWAARKLQAGKLLHYCGGDGGRDWRSVVAVSQRVQATALQVGLESCRLRRQSCGGVAFWQFNEPWRAVSWSVIDRAGRPKLAYEMLKRSCQPLLVAARFQWRAYRRGDVLEADIWLANDGPHDWQDCTITAALDGLSIWRSEPCVVAGQSACPAGTIAHTLASVPSVLTLELAQDGRVLAENRYDLAVPRPRPVAWRHRLYRSVTQQVMGTG